MTHPQHPGDANDTVPPQQPHPQPQQWQGTDGQPLPAVGDPTSPPPAGKNRTTVIVAAAAVFAVLVLAVGGYAVWDRFIKEDTGVAACKAMRDGKNVDGSTEANDDDKMTEAEYREARKLFEDSRHEDIRKHGTALIDVAWQVSSLDEGEEMGALAFMGPLSTHMSGLQTACADQGVIVNLNKK
ncbi:hypothetical protein [Micromonospora psammae]|uniref:hypothetical protein n=1 Tax=Micromonospora sp. CPCC 205556 TaxID=3122398 RepID=UPI002FEF9F06